MDDQQFRQFLEHFGYSWRGYRKVRKGVKKRIIKHMQEIGCRSMETYLDSLDRDEALRDQCESLMCVSISRFFRDRLLWKAVEDQIVPGLLEENIKRLKLWFAGCACGEEVYSFKILWEGLKDRFDHPMPELGIWATDINRVFLRRAQDGVYAFSSLKEVPVKLKEIFFISHGDRGPYTIVPSLKQGIRWRVHNLSSKFDEFNFHIIFLRNSILTYYNDELKQAAFQKVIDSLNNGGFLIIGTHEKLPFESGDLVPFGSQHYVFKKIRR
jgi:chemotaxis protein methyltransferase CheR